MQATQLQINFPDVDGSYAKTGKEIFVDDRYRQEFEQGNFQNAWTQSNYSASELTKLLLVREGTDPEFQYKILKNMTRNIDQDIESILYEKHKEKYRDTKESIRAHNDIVRERLKKAFEKTPQEALENQGLDKFYLYNNYYWKRFGGKSLKNKRNSFGYIKDSNDELHDEYIKIKTEHISYCKKLIQNTGITKEQKEKLQKYIKNVLKVPY